MRVLVGIDEDSLFEDVLATLRWCVRLGKGDQVLVLHATPVFPWVRRAGEMHMEWEAWVRAEEEKAEKLVAAADRHLRSWDVPGEMLRADGDPAKEILRVASELAADLIVVGIRGDRERGFLVGSVSQKIKTLAQTDVLMVKRGAPVESGHFRALIAVDGSPESLGAVKSFATKTQAERAEARLVHVLDLPLTVWDVIGAGETLNLASLPAPLRDQVDRTLSSALATLQSHGIQATTEVRKGRAAEEILGAAAAFHPHLVAMGSRGLSGVRGLLLGSVTQRVVRHGDASVLVARQRVEAPLVEK